MKMTETPDKSTPCTQYKIKLKHLPGCKVTDIFDIKFGIPPEICT